MRTKAIALATAALMLIAGCGGGGGGNATTGPANEPKPAAKEESKAEPKVDITFWTYPKWSGINGTEQGGQLGDYERDAAKRFMAQHPNVNVKVEVLDFNNGPQKVNVALAANEAPDVLMDGPVRFLGYAQQGYLEPLDEHLGKDYTGAFISTLWDQTTIGDGKHYYIPWGTSPNVMLINKTLVDKAGLADKLPKDEERTWTTDQFISFIKEVQQKTGVKGTGLFAGSESGDAFMFNYIWAAGATTYNDKFTKIALNNPAGLSGLQFMKRLADEKLINDGAAALKATDAYNLFYDQKLVSMSAAPVHYSRGLAAIRDKKSAPYEMIMTSYPTFPGKQKSATVLGTFGMAVFKNKDQNKLKYAVEFAKFLGSRENAAAVKASSSFSAYADINKTLFASEKDSNMEFAAKLLPYAVNEGFAAPGYNEIRKNNMAHLQKLILGSETPEDALQKMETEGNQLLEKYTKIIQEQRK
ncbi:ABC transporter substrate-binding protein [Paenibacillus thalictri]|uniref:Sugar ABC transporter substrate-binding protein n=1 Tax=Paenibacillus thalictri TaxID=2527873 RepID=A0A4Q9DLV6_9BACL|nr:sugar ABC transporter substrate-binding protein [Paenibacillus thalictri]TBL76265.1 sugar ABC transporter substrate-binding protein [Paenibacillus thalictri]